VVAPAGGLESNRSGSPFTVSVSLDGETMFLDWRLVLSRGPTQGQTSPGGVQGRPPAMADAGQAGMWVR